ncbi:uncharacterized protein LOC113776780 [Coffea eugenioides]|uniref:uncharacterized protein LOC113776780 n=1 Tax=Coffea eugenioides TaxID=49369 RepID=UPI000F60AA82|nr:uncharacterized protein LOC113776780 [Coffea eugenioides]
MAWCEPEIMCEKHPNQRQQPGFCSSCLNERLAKLPSFTFSMAPSRSSSSLSSSPAFNSSASSSTCTSPTHHRANHHHRTTSTGLNPFMIHGKHGLMRKSKSIAYVARRRARSGLDGKKKEGFWSKLIRSTSVKTKGVLVRSKTGKERFEH